MKIAVVVFPGTNCEHDVVHAIELLDGKPTLRSIPVSPVVVATKLLGAAGAFNVVVALAVADHAELPAVLVARMR